MRLFDRNGTLKQCISRELKIEPGSIVQVAGSGGKTSLISQIARENRWQKVAVLTTTKRYAPRENGVILQPGTPLTLSGYGRTVAEIGTAAEHGKIGWLGEQNYRIVQEWADIILIEADGSRGKPLKAAAEYEPALVSDATHTLVVCGLSALGSPFMEACHRWELAMDMIRPHSKVTKQTIIDLLHRFYQRRLAHLHPAFILNQADDAELVQTGASLLNLGKLDGWVTSLRNE